MFQMRNLAESQPAECERSGGTWVTDKTNKPFCRLEDETPKPPLDDRKPPLDDPKPPLDDPKPPLEQSCITAGDCPNDQSCCTWDNQLGEDTKGTCGDACLFGIFKPAEPPEDEKALCERRGGVWVTDRDSTPFCDKPPEDEKALCERRGGVWVTDRGNTPFCYFEDEKPVVPPTAPRFRCLNFPTAQVLLPIEGSNIFEVYPTIRHHLNKHLSEKKGGSRVRCSVVADGFYTDGANRYGDTKYATFQTRPTPLPKLSGGSLVNTIERQVRAESNKISKEAAKSAKKAAVPPQPLPPAACKMSRAHAGKGCSCKFDWEASTAEVGLNSRGQQTNVRPSGLTLECPA
jgi:hypothetical protein